MTEDEKDPIDAVFESIPAGRSNEMKDTICERITSILVGIGGKTLSAEESIAVVNQLSFAMNLLNADVEKAAQEYGRSLDSQISRYEDSLRADIRKRRRKNADRRLRSTNGLEAC